MSGAHPPANANAAAVVPRFHGVLVLALSALLVSAGCGTQGTLGAKALGEQSTTVQSLAAEGALLAEDAAAGKSTGTYRREHSSELATAASKAEATLKDASTEPALESKLRTLAGLAARVRGNLERIGSASEKEQRALARALNVASQQSERIGEGLE